MKTGIGAGEITGVVLEGVGRTVLGGGSKEDGTGKVFPFCFQLTQFLEIHVSGERTMLVRNRDAKTPPPPLLGNWGESHLTKLGTVFIK